MKKRVLFSVLCLLMALSAFSKNPQTQGEVRLRIGTYNLRMQNMDKGDNAWPLRRARVVESINDNAFDIFGVQELTVDAEKDLAWSLERKYGAIFFSPYSQDGIGGKAQGVFYDKKRFKLVSYHYFWPSDTPFEKTENDHFTDGSGRSYIRGGVCMVFKDKLSGKKIFFMGSHSIINKDDHLKYAHVYVDIEKQFNPEGYPSFYVGDLNARVDNPVHRIYREYWNDAADIVPERPCTMNAFSTDPAKWDPARHIDFIYYRNTGTPVKYECNQKLYDGFCASDHFPVWADFIIN